MDHPIPVTFIRLIVLLPLLGAAINFLAGAWLQKTFGKRAISIVGCGVVLAAFGVAVTARDSRRCVATGLGAVRAPCQGRKEGLRLGGLRDVRDE